MVHRKTRFFLNFGCIIATYPGFIRSRISGRGHEIINKTRTLSLYIIHIITLRSPLFDFDWRFSDHEFPRSRFQLSPGTSRAFSLFESAEKRLSGGLSGESSWARSLSLYYNEKRGMYSQFQSTLDNISIFSIIYYNIFQYNFQFTIIARSHERIPPNNAQMNFVRNSFADNRRIALGKKTKNSQ